MKELAFLGIATILLFVGFVVFWNKKWKGKILDEREVHIRLKVRELTSRSIEIALITGIIFHLSVQPLTGIQAFLVVGLSAILAETFGNWWLRRDISE